VLFRKALAAAGFSDFEKSNDSADWPAGRQVIAAIKPFRTGENK